jgi:glycosyltransferase involved in cell wall biosynthesis
LDARPIRVLLVSPTFGAYGGMEAFVLAVADALVADSRFEVRVCFKKATGFMLQSGFAEVCESLPIEFLDRGSRQLWSAIKWADVVHGQNASPDVAVMARLLGRPLALSIPNNLPSGPPARRLSWRIAAALATIRWYISEFVWNTWEPGRHRSASARVPTTSRLPTAFVAPAARRGFVFLGRLVAGKGADILIDAYVRTGLDPECWPLTILGDGPLRAGLEAHCVRHGIRGVRFAGFVHGDAKAQALARARWLVVPSHWQEPFGLVAHEARSVGVPCIVSADGGLPEAAGVDALVCKPADVDSLATALRQAAAMSDADYVERAGRSHADLEHELVAASFYLDAYCALLGRQAHVE